MTVPQAFLIDYIGSQLSSLSLWEKYLKGVIEIDRDKHQVILYLGDEAGEAAWVDDYENEDNVCIHADCLRYGAFDETIQLYERDNCLSLESCKTVVLLRIINHINKIINDLISEK